MAALALLSLTMILIIINIAQYRINFILIMINNKLRSTAAPCDIFRLPQSVVKIEAGERENCGKANLNYRSFVLSLIHHLAMFARSRTKRHHCSV